MTTINKIHYQNRIGSILTSVFNVLKTVMWLENKRNVTTIKENLKNSSLD